MSRTGVSFGCISDGSVSDGDMNGYYSSHGMTAVLSSGSRGVEGGGGASWQTGHRYL